MKPRPRPATRRGGRARRPGRRGAAWSWSRSSAGYPRPSRRPCPAACCTAGGRQADRAGRRRPPLRAFRWCWWRASPPDSGPGCRGPGPAAGRPAGRAGRPLGILRPTSRGRRPGPAAWAPAPHSDGRRGCRRHRRNRGRGHSSRRSGPPPRVGIRCPPAQGQRPGPAGNARRADRPARSRRRACTGAVPPAGKEHRHGVDEGPLAEVGPRIRQSGRSSAATIRPSRAVRSLSVDGRAARG